MKKVIVKCKLRNRDDFEARLAKMELDLGAVFWQHERVYVPRNYQKQSSFPRLILRTEVRAVDKPAKYELELRRHIEDSGVDVVDVTAVKDYTEAANIILQLGFLAQAEISSRRREMVLGEGTKLMIDKLDGVSGSFAKIEAELNENDSVEAVRLEIVKRFQELGQDATTLMFNTYAEA